MSRVLLQRALDALEVGIECMRDELENMDRVEVSRRGDAAQAEIDEAQTVIDEIAAALAQPDNNFTARIMLDGLIAGVESDSEIPISLAELKFLQILIGGQP